MTNVSPGTHGVSPGTSKAPKAHRKSKMQIFVISSHPLNGAGHMGPGLRPDFWQVEKYDVKASAMPSLKCSLMFSLSKAPL